MHQPTSADEKALFDISAWVLDRLANRERTLPPRQRTELAPITDAGVGIEAAWMTLRDEVLPTAVPSDHPRYLAFIPGSPTVASVLADMVVSASGVYAGGELDAGAMIAAERAALRWLSDLAGLPESAHGAFVSGGSIANLSALVAARHRAAERSRVLVSAAEAPADHSDRHRRALIGQGGRRHHGLRAEDSRRWRRAPGPRVIAATARRRRTGPGGRGRRHRRTHQQRRDRRPGRR